MKEIPDFSFGAVREFYEGPFGALFHAQVGEHLHAGMALDTDDMHEASMRVTETLAQRAQVTKGKKVLDIGCGIAGPACYLAKTFNCSVTGINISVDQVAYAHEIIRKQGLEGQVEVIRANALSMPLKKGTFDIVWGQDAWIHIPQKPTLLKEAYRLLKKGGGVAFTDWLKTPHMNEEELKKASECFNFSVPSMETIEGYISLLKGAGFSSIMTWDMGDHFRRWTKLWLKDTQARRGEITVSSSEDYYKATVDAIAFYVDMAEERKATWGMFTARKE